MASNSKLALLLLCGAAVFMIASATKLGHCGESCKTHDDCFGKLACMKGNKCTDDPDLKTRICSSRPKPCGSPCHSHNECLGKLACMHKKCGDDPDLRTHICKKQAQPPKGAPAPHAAKPGHGHAPPPFSFLFPFPFPKHASPPQAGHGY